LVLAHGFVVAPPLSAQGGAVATVSVEPTAVQIGGSGSPTRLGSLSGAALMSDGQIVLADTPTLEIGLYTPYGARRAQFGRVGDGPGEFRSISALEVGANDSIYVFDARLQRLSVFDQEGALVRATLISAQIGIRVGTVGRLGPDTWYAKEAASVLPSGVGRDRTLVVLLDRQLNRTRDVTTVPDYVTGSVPMGGQVAARFVPFSPRALTAHGGSCLFVMASDEQRLLVFEEAGRQAASVPVPATPRRISEGDMEAWAAHAVRELPPQAAAAALSALSTFPHAPTFPLFNTLLVDDLGYVWLQEFAPPLGAGPRWKVVGARGVVVAHVVFPEGVRPLVVRGSTVVAAEPGTSGGDVVRLYTLTGEARARDRQGGVCADAAG
jgi:hypothetical protein